MCIVALLVRRKCQQADLNNQAIYNQSTVSSSGGYATTKPHTRSSWTCTYKAGHPHQVDTHIWETPLPEPSTDEYTLPTNMRHNNKPISNAMLDSMEYTVPISSATAQCGHSSAQAEYTQPVKPFGKQNNVIKKPAEDSNADSIVPSDKCISQANYYYYDPSSGEQSEYMAPTVAKTLDALPAQNSAPERHHNVNTEDLPVCVPVQETRECDYRTLIRLDDAAK